jgi:urease accessory protein
MLQLVRRVTEGQAREVLSLVYDERKKSRLLACTESGREVGIMLERGSSLRDGELLAADSGEIVMVRAALESVSQVRSNDALALQRAAYHLGNRHVPLQISPAGLSYQHDHVLDDMMRELGLQVSQQLAAFDPERGAYAGLGHAQGAEQSLDHAHAHAHGDEQGHSRGGGGER